MSTAGRGTPGAALGVGIVGLSASGGWGGRAHVPAIRAVDGIELRALAASSPESAARAADEFGVPAAADPRQLAERDDVDLVVVSVKVPDHHELVSAVLGAGKAVLCEWPLGNGLAEAEDLAGRAEAAGVRTFVGLQARSAPVIRHLRDLVADGYVGEILSTSMIGSGDGWGGTCTSRSAYVLDRANGATLLTIPFGHAVDGLTFVLGEFVGVSATTARRRVTARNTDTGELVPVTAEDQVAVTGTLTSGAVASVHLRGGTSPGTNLLWQIDGTEGTLVVTGGTGQIQFGAMTVCGARGSAALEELPLPRRYERVPALQGRPAEPVTTMAHAYHAIRTDLAIGTTSVPDFAHAVRRHRFLDVVAAGGMPVPAGT